jgi:hypothetical protein
MPSNPWRFPAISYNKSKTQSPYLFGNTSTFGLLARWQQVVHRYCLSSAVVERERDNHLPEIFRTLTVLPFDPTTPFQWSRAIRISRFKGTPCGNEVLLPQ